MTNKKQLQTVATFLQAGMLSQGFKVDYTVENVWADMGAGIKHDTVIATFGDRTFQIFSPKELDKIEANEFTLGDLQNTMNEHMKMFS